MQAGDRLRRGVWMQGRGWLDPEGRRDRLETRTQARRAEEMEWRDRLERDVAEASPADLNLETETYELLPLTDIR